MDKDIFFPQFVFEIRFNHLLNFKDVYRDTLSQFVKLAERFTINKQNIVEENIVFHFTPDHYRIIASWDRLAFQSEGSFAYLKQSNSIIDIPFFKMYKEISSLDSFSSAQHSIMQAMAVKPKEKGDNPLEQIKEGYFTEKIETLLPKSTDVAIVLENKDKDQEISLNYGPYHGLEDLSKRDALPKNPENIPNTDYGEMAVIKIVERTSSVNVKDFRRQCDVITKQLSRIWQ